MGIVVLDADGIVSSVTGQIRDWTGTDAASFAGKVFSSLFRPGDRERIARQVERVRSGQSEPPITCRLLGQQGSELLVQVQMVRVGDDTGAARAFAGIFTSLLNDDSRASLTGLTMPVPVFPSALALMDDKGTANAFSANWGEVVGSDAPIPDGSTLDKLFTGLKKIRPAKTKPNQTGVFVRRSGPDEAHRTLYVITLRLEGAISEFTQVATIQNTSAFEEILQRLGHQVGIINQAGDAIIAADADFHITLWNRCAEQMYGWTAAEVLGKEISEVIEIAMPADSRNAIREEVAARGNWRGRVIHYGRNGEELMVDSSISVLKDALGAVTGSIAVNRDVSAQEATETALGHSEALFRSVVSNLGEGVLLTDETGTVLYVNERLAEITGYGASELIGRTIYKVLYDEELWPSMAKRIQERIAGKSEKYQSRILRNDGSYLWAEVNSVPHYNENREITGALALMTDISHRKNLEERLLERDRILATTAEASFVLITSSDLEKAVNKSLRILGEGLNVDRIYIFQNHYHPETGETLSSQLFEWTSEGVTPQIDNPLLQNFPISALPRWEKLLTEGQPVSTIVRNAPKLEQIVLTPQDIQSILVVPIQLDGGFWGFVGFDDCRSERMWTETERALLATVAGNVGGAVKRMQAEHELVHARVRAEEASERSTQFLANVSHEFRSPLAVVLGYADLLRAVVEAGDDVPRETVLDSLTAIRRAGKRLQALVHNLLETNSIEEGTLHLTQNEIEVNALVSNVIDELGPIAIDKGLQVKVDLWREPIKIEGDPVRAEEIITNLVENAIKFTREGYVSISTHLETHAERETVLIEVEDTGVGMSDEYLAQLFDPFTQESYGTTRAYEGAGIGLALSQRLANLMGGTIRALSTKNKGSRFIVELPSAGAAQRYQSGPGLFQSGTETDSEAREIPEVLLVGPHRPVYRLWQHLLQQECAFTLAADAAEALSSFEPDKTSIVLVDLSHETDYAGVREIGERLALHAKPDAGPLLIGAHAGESAPPGIEQASFDDTISHDVDLDAFFEKFLHWLPQVSDSDT